MRTNYTTKYTETKDIQCNAYDLASNVYEWKIEINSSKEVPTVVQIHINYMNK